MCFTDQLSIVNPSVVLPVARILSTFRIEAIRASQDCQVAAVAIVTVTPSAIVSGPMPRAFFVAAMVVFSR